MKQGDSQTGRVIRWLYPHPFRVLAIADSKASDVDLKAAYQGGDILLFPAWFNNPASLLIESFAGRPDSR